MAYGSALIATHSILPAMRRSAISNTRAGGWVARARWPIAISGAGCRVGGPLEQHPASMWWEERHDSSHGYGCAWLGRRLDHSLRALSGVLRGPSRRADYWGPVAILRWIGRSAN